MSDRTEDATPRPQIGPSWIPTTPAMPNSSKCRINSPENNPVQADWPRTDNVVTGANLSEVVCQTSDPCPTSSENSRELGKGFSNNLEMDEVTKSRYRGENVPKGESSACKKLSFEDADTLSFGELLARAQAGFAVPRNDYEAASALAPSQMQGGSSSCSRPLFDLNTVPKSNDEASSSKIAPVTPEKSVIAKDRSDSAVKHIIIDEENSAKQAKEMVITLDNADGVQMEKEPSQLSIDHQLRASVSTQLQENHKPDKGSTEEADLSKTLQRKPRRRKHRPKVIREGKPRISRKRNVEVSVTTQDATPAKKRRGRPKANKPDDAIDKGSNEPADVSTHRQPRRSCRRSLNFNSEGLVNDDSPLNGQALEKSVTESLSQSWTGDNGSGTGKAKSDAATATCSETCFTVEREVQGLERHHMDTPVAEFCDMNATGIVYNSMQASTATFNHDADDNRSAPELHFPATYKKKKRTEKRHNAVAFSSTSSYNYETATKPSASSTNQGPSSAQCSPINPLTDCVSSATRDGRTFHTDLLFAIETVKRKRSKVPTRVRDFTSQPEIEQVRDFTSQPEIEQVLDFTSQPEIEQVPTYQGVPLPALTPSVEHKTVILHEPQTCMEALVAYNSSTNLTPKTKKRSKRSVISSGFVLDFDFATQSMGPPLAITWKSQVSIDSITEQLSELDLNAEISEESSRNLSMAYQMHYQERHALVPFQSQGTIVPFDSSFNRVRRRRPRAKVDLDDETTRVWELLLENINSEGVDGTNEEKAKWWEEERRVFKGRADSFIARMHLVQGDRRFSPWKGSVVDSVVGVFLTQNVSDHLSSSAFMSLVAKYQAKSEIHLAGGTKVQEPDWCMLGPDATFISNRQDNSFCSVESTVLDDFGNDDVREVNSTKAHGNHSDGSVHHLESQSSAASKHVPVVSHESCTNKSMSPIRDGRDKEDVISSQKVEISSQSSADSPIAHTTEISESCLRSTSEEPTTGTRSNEFATYSVSQVAGTVQHVCDEETEGQKSGLVQCANLDLNLQNENNLDNTLISANYQPLGRESTLCHSSDSETLATVDLSQESDKVSTIENEPCIAATCVLLSESASQTAAATNEDEPQFSSPVQVEMEKTVGNMAGHAPTERFLVDNHSEMQEISDIPSQNSKGIRESGTKADSIKMSECKEVNSIKNDADYEPGGKTNRGKVRGEKTRKGKEKVDWDCLREQSKKDGKQRGKTPNTMDSVDWDAVRCADVHEIAKTIKERGMNNVLAGRIKDFLNRLVTDHGSIDLEWLRDVPPDDAKEYLLSIRGLGLKSVECVRLLTLHHLAFPVDTNVGRIAVRLGWVPLQPLPESLQLHLLELYPVLESIQKYLWPRLCKLDQKTLYELHYQMITFGKVFCTKSKPNCNACPMRGECRHFASAFASARLSLPAPEEKSLVTTTEERTAGANVPTFTNPLQLPSNYTDAESVVSNSQPIIEVPPSPEPTIEVPATPGRRNIDEYDIEDAFLEDPDEIPTIHLNMEEFNHNLQNFMQQATEFQDGDMTKALVALTAEAASIPVPKLKNVSRLRTEHRVYELPDSHPLLEGLDKREPDDPCPYMLAIWTPGETVNSITPPKRQCNSQESEKLCNDETCLSCNSIREATLHTVRGTLLIPCRTAMRGNFPLNGTYFQVNEVFADHESSLSPMNVPRQWLWNLPRRIVYFGTSIPTIFKGLSTEGIQYCFWRGFVCVRGFERKTRLPRPLIARLHFAASRLNKGKEKMDENQS